MHLFAILAAALSVFTSQAHAGVTVSVWTPGVVVFDPYDPGFHPGPRVDYIWISGGYDEYGYYTPGYWQPVAANPGFLWVSGYWSGRTYYEGYWRPAHQSGHAWIDGYYVNGRYVSPRWVRESEADSVRARNRAYVAARQPPREHATGQRDEAAHTEARHEEPREARPAEHSPPKATPQEPAPSTRRDVTKKKKKK